MRIKQILSLWRQRNLSLQGRATVINTLLMSKLWYTLSVVSIPEWARKTISKSCKDCLWNYGAHLVSYKTIIGEKTQGGLKIVDVYLKQLSYRLKYLAKYFCSDKQVTCGNTLSYTFCIKFVD
jgi:hypothetical protein